ncbi:reverse transcriptase domain-containing protein, partial [Tanacetum coccineum]
KRISEKRTKNQVKNDKTEHGMEKHGKDKFEISSWRGVRVGVRTYLLGGAIDGSEANGIICDSKLELESSRFTFDLVPLSYESVDVVVGENWLLRHKAEMVCHEKVVKMPWKRISEKRTKNEAKNDKTEHGMEKNIKR